MWKSEGLDVNACPEISQLMANLARNPLRKPRKPIEWDLALVLRVFAGPPFEPLQEASLKMLTLKTVFLFALASGRRRSELHALTRDSLAHTERWSSISVCPHMDFVAKTRLAQEGASVLDAVSFPSLDDFLGPDLAEDRLSCPVRALRLYVKRTDRLRTTQKLLFISFQEGRSDDISVNTISSWIKQAVQLAYSLVSPDTCRLLQVRAHDVRGVAASLAFLRNAPMHTILAACTWRSHTTFTSFYLKDVAYLRHDLHTLGPVVAATHRA